MQEVHIRHLHEGMVVFYAVPVDEQAHIHRGFELEAVADALHALLGTEGGGDVAESAGGFGAWLEGGAWFEWHQGNLGD